MIATPYSRITVTEEDIDQYIKELVWASDTKLEEKELAIIHIRRFYTWLQIKEKPPTTISGVWNMSV